MRVSKLYSALLIAFLTIGFVACNNTVSSTDTSDNGGMNFIPGFEPGKKKADSSKVTPVLSSSSDLLSSSLVDVSSSSAGVAVLDSVIDVSEKCDASECMEDVADDVVTELETLKLQLDDNESVQNFTEDVQSRFAPGDFDFSKNDYYCFTQSEEWFKITKEGLQGVDLSFVWADDQTDVQVNYVLDFGNLCESVYIKTN